MKITSIWWVMPMAFALLACQQDGTKPGDDIYTGEYMFEPHYIDMSTDTNQVIVDTPITITTTVHPKFSGTGFHVLEIPGVLVRSVEDSIPPAFFTTPFQDTLTPSSKLLRYRVHFKKGEPAQVRWSFTIHQESDALLFQELLFQSRAWYDSVWVPDSSKMYPVYQTILLGMAYENSEENPLHGYVEHTEFLVSSDSADTLEFWYGHGGSGGYHPYHPVIGEEYGWLHYMPISNSTPGITLQKPE